MNTEIDWLHEQIEAHARELRRLKKWRSSISDGDSIRSTSIIGTLPGGGGGTGIVTTAPMWYLWTNQSGAVRQQGTVVVQSGNRTFGVTTTVDDPLVIGVLDESDIAVGEDALVRHIGFQPVVLTQGAVAAGHYLRASTTAGRAEDAGTAPTPATFGWALTASGGGASSVVAYVDTGLRHPAGGGTGTSGTANEYLNGGLFCSSNELDLDEGSGVWISGTCAGGLARWKVGAYASAPAGAGLSGIAVALDGTDFCFAGGLDFHQGAGVWISGSCAAGQADVTFGAYATAAPTSVSGTDWAANQGHLGFGNAADLRQNPGVWISGTFAGGQANYEIGGYPAASPPTSISGVDFSLDGGAFCWGHVLDLVSGSGVWISGTCSSGQAHVTFGAYPSAAAPTSISGVDFRFDGGSLCWGHVLEFDEGSGVWISGSCVGGIAAYKVGAYPQPALLTYALPLLATTLNPMNKNVTYYFGGLVQILTTTADLSRLYIPNAGTITSAVVAVRVANNPTNEAVSVSIRLNNAADTLVQTKAIGAGFTLFSNAALSIAVIAGDYIEIKVVCPNWVTAPTGTYWGGSIYVT